MAEALNGAPEPVSAIRDQIAAAEQSLATARAAEPELAELDAVTRALDAKVASLAAQIVPLQAELELCRLTQVRDELQDRMSRFDAAIGSVRKLAVEVFGSEQFLNSLGHAPGVRVMATSRLCLPPFDGSQPLTIESIALAVGIEADGLRARWGMSPRASQAPTMRFT